MHGVGHINRGANSIAPLPGISLVEIYGQNRVLVENHRGIAGYEDHAIQINVNFGRIIVSGHHLKLRNMSKEKLVITGKICGVNLQGRE